MDIDIDIVVDLNVDLDIRKVESRKCGSTFWLLLWGSLSMAGWRRAKCRIGPVRGSVC